MEYTIDNLVVKLRDIKSQGYIKTHRRGNTGIGKTIEDLLDVPENNLQIADWGTFELKTKRKGSSSRTTLFTKEPIWKNGWSWRTILDQYGYTDDKDRIAYKKTIYNNSNSVLSTRFNENENLDLLCEGEVIGTWSKEILVNKLQEKLKNTVFIYSDVKRIDGTEHFHFQNAELATGVNWSVFRQLIEDDTLVLESRIHYKKDGSLRNRGTPFRIQSKYIDDLYEKTRSLNL